MSVDMSHKLISWILDTVQPLSDDRFNPGYSIFHIEVGTVGYSISAKKVTGQHIDPYWVIRDFSTYNA